MLVAAMQSDGWHARPQSRSFLVKFVFEKLSVTERKPLSAQAKERAGSSSAGAVAGGGGARHRLNCCAFHDCIRQVWSHVTRATTAAKHGNNQHQIRNEFYRRFTSAVGSLTSLGAHVEVGCGVGQFRIDSVWKRKVSNSCWTLHKKD